MREIRLTRIQEQDFHYPDDVDRIVQAFAAGGLICSPYQAWHMWDEHSNDRCAGWLGVPDNNAEIVSLLTSKYYVLEEF